ncbi:MAG TPA: tyrosine-type recombinase/integrase [Chloroflexia bacterium]|nr:tyrosine-type recombinase/integrase [Chloroflexia bacterium]
MKRKTADSLKIPSGFSPSEGTGAEGIFASGAPGAPATTSTTPPSRLQKLVEEWLEYCQSGGLSPETLRDYRAFVYKFYWWWTDHTGYAGTCGDGPDSITTRHFREFVSYLRTPTAARWGTPMPLNKQSLSPTTISTYGRHIKVFFNWLEQEGYIERSPINRSVKFSTKSKQDKVIKLVEQAELARLFSFLNRPERLKNFTGTRDLAIIALLLDSGMRIGELLSMRICDLDLKGGRCTVKGKTGRRMAVFGAVSRSALTAYLQHPYHPKPPDKAENEADQALWLTIDGAPLSFFGCQTLIRRLREESGVRFHAHQLRHTFATTMAAQGVNLYDLKGLMGHTDIQTTQIYLHDNVDRLSEVYRPHSPLSVIPGLDQAIKKTRGRPRKWQE